jgi:peptidoglycan/LPS O-acetylase OafA/YrhL
VGRIEWANALRGLAALAVLISHFAHAFWTRQTQATLLTYRDPLYSGQDGVPAFARFIDVLPLKIGAFGIAIFFLLSGYVITLSLTRYSRMGFLAGRLMRVLPVYAAGYLVTYAVICNSPRPGGELSPAAEIMIGMAPGLSFILGIPIPKDGVVWTLIIELVFYLLCVLFHGRIASCWKTIVAIALACALTQWMLMALPPSAAWGSVRFVILLVCAFLPVVLIGMVLASYSLGGLTALPTALLIMLLTVLFLVLIGASQAFPMSPLYKLTFVATIPLFIAVWAFAGTWKGHWATGSLAKISFPLYVAHPVLGYTLLTVLAGNGVPPTLALIVAMAAAITVAYLLHVLVEAPAHTLGKRWARQLSQPRDGGVPLQWRLSERRA